MGRRLGDPGDPLLVSVRSGAEVLDARDDGDGPQRRPQRRVGARPGRRRATTSGSRWTPTAGCSRCSAPPCSASRPRCSPTALDELKKDRGTESDTDLGVDDLRELVETFKQRDLASTPAATSRRTRASSSTSRCAPSSTRGTPSAPSSTAARSGSPRTSAPRSTCRRWSSATAATTPAPGVAFTRDPASGQPGRVRRLPPERAGRGRRRRHPQHRVAGRHGARSTRRRTTSCSTIMATLEKHYRDMCDIEFTVERGKLWMLQTRVGKRTPEAAFRIGRAHDRRGPHRHRRGAAPGDRRPARAADVPALRRERRAHAARDGHERLPRRRRRQGRLRLRHRRRVGRARRGRDPGPQGDQPRRPARHGRRPGHPHQPRRQDLARGRRRPRHGPHLRLRRRVARRERRRSGAPRSAAATPINEGDVISIDGTTGEVFLGAVPVVDSRR